ncbi:MAG: type II toxin-antitoxin system HicB family antitoxin [Desulfobacteraceae bacterium]|nr:MAG: type II toxin-antitoxin system HicB family antitoxin [Desulfobacteraceae bacterium]
MMNYKGYYGHVGYDDEVKIFHGEVLNARTVITLQGNNVDEIEKAFKDSVDDYLDWCRQRGKEPEKPFSGKFVLRIPTELHRKLSLKAKENQLSINSYIIETLNNSVS